MSTANQLIAIGASAGGLDPLQEFFDAMPEDSGMGFVVIQHLSPDHPSLMDELLSRHTKMKVRRVENGMEVEPNTVYVIQPKTYMRVHKGRLQLTQQSRDRDMPPTPIDVFFESLAEDYGERGAAIVMSGTGTDGSRGIRKVHEAGGRTIAQDSSAKFDGMPRAAIDTDSIDMILPPAEMPAFLTGKEDEDGVRPSLVNATPGIYEVLEVLRERHGLDFAHYKITTVLRRIERRVQLTHATSVQRYLERLRESEDEQDKLYRDLLIGVTRFFRDADAFRVLEERVIPELLAEKSESDEDGLRIWIAGCASGEEAYSVAMLIHEIAHRMGRTANARIFATDAHKGSIDHASAGRYPPELMEDISEERRDRYFVRNGDEFQVGPALRSMITFAPHNLLADAPFTRMDLVICRNMLIYFKPSAQNRVLSLLHFALKVNGVLMMGSSETVGRLHNEFTAMDAHWRIYRKKRDVRLVMEREISGLSPRMDLHSRVLPPTPTAPSADVRIQKAYDEILGGLLPAGMLLNDRRELVHTFGRAKQMLRPPEGRASLDVLEMVDPEARVPLSAAIVRATKEQRAFRYGSVPISLGDEREPRTIEAKPIQVSPESPPYVLVTILDEPKQTSDAAATAPVHSGDYTPDDLSVQKISALEHELQYTKENLQATVEEMETTNEELNATNEELIASNEELQSTNEELQSVNEELHTVNAEYQQKITELTALTDDMDNLLACTDIGTLFLDPDMNVRKFTPAVQDHFRLREQDLGRPLEEITTQLRDLDLLDRARHVYSTGTPEECETIGGGGLSLLVRVTPYRTARGLIDGVVVTLVDISRMKEAEALAAKLAEQNQVILDHIPAWVWYKDRQCRVIRVNRAAAEATGLPIEQIEGARTEDLHPNDAEQYISDDREVMASGKKKIGIVEPFTNREGEHRWLRTDKVPTFDDRGEVNGVIVVTMDITQLKEAQDRLAALSQRLELSMAGAQQAAWDWRPVENTVVYSDTWYTMLGYKPRELPMTFDTWERQTHPDDAPRVLSNMQEHFTGKRDRFDAEVRLRTKSGDWKWVRSIGEVVERNQAGEPTWIAGMHVDIDTIKQSELALKRVNEDLEGIVTERTREVEVARGRFERAVRGAQAGLWEWIVDSDDAWYADTYWELLGYTPSDRPPNRLEALNEHLHPDDSEALWAAVKHTIKSGEAYSARHRLRKKDGSYRWFHARGVLVEDPESGKPMLSGSTMDVHDEVTYESELKKATRELESRVDARTMELSEHVATLADRNEQLDQFAHVASHDLRAPLRTIGGFAELAVQAKESEERDDHLERVLKGVRRLDTLLDGLSAYSRVGRAEFTLGDVDLDDLVADVRADLSTDVERAEATIHLESLGKVRGDERLLRQVMLNLLGNAIKFRDKDAPVVWVNREDRAGEVVIRVRDNGIGVDTEYASEIFEPFRRLHSHSTYSGSGVGLSVCRRVVERHGGEIWVESEKGEGATFAFTLPKRIEEAPDA